MRRVFPCLLAVVAVALVASMLPRRASAADVSAERITAIYFHRTKRCPTCLKMGSYSEEAVKTGFAQQLQDGTVGFYYVDFQDPGNAALAGNRTSSPGLRGVSWLPTYCTRWRHSIWAC